MGYGGAMPQQCYTHMRIEERDTLSLGLALGQSLRTMARVLGGAPSTVSRESARNARGTPIGPAPRSTWRQPGPVGHGDHASSWTYGSGSMSEPTWARVFARADCGTSPPRVS